MEPIANSNLAAQKYQTNNFQLASYFQLKDMISGGGIFIENRPQKTEKRATEATPEEQKKKFEDFSRCDYVSDGVGGFHAKEVMLDETKEYAIFFIPKNRNGSKTEQVIFEVDYNTNNWTEVGYARMKKSAR